MEIFETRKINSRKTVPSYKTILGIILMIIIINTIHIFNLYIVRFGSLDFFSLKDHFFAFCNLMIALLAVIIAWNYTKKKFEETLRRLFASFFLALLIFSVFTSFYYILMRVLIGEFTSLSFLAAHILFSFSSAFIHVAGLTLAVLFYSEKLKTEIENLSIRREKQALEHQLLVRNLEPHFLLNTLSSFSHLIQKDKQEAELFMENFTSIYKYFIRHNQTDLVDLSDEINFVEHYFYLVNSRFGKVYQLKIDLNFENKYLTPFAIQMCVENAIKHNEASDEEPLVITIENDSDYVLVRNDYRPVKNYKGVGYGIKNIKHRSLIITGEEIIVENQNGAFLVKIPLISTIG